MPWQENTLWALQPSALYLACIDSGEDRTQVDIAEAAGVTEVTIRNRCKSLKEALSI